MNPKIKEILESKRIGFYLLFIAWFWQVCMQDQYRAEFGEIMETTLREPPYEWSLFSAKYRALSMVTPVIVLGCYITWAWQRRKYYNYRWIRIILTAVAFQIFCRISAGSAT